MLEIYIGRGPPLFLYHEDVDVQISGEFFGALTFVLKVSTLKVPTLKKRCFFSLLLQFS